MVTNNGTPIAADQWVTVSSLSGLAFVGSDTPCTDHIWLQAYNGVWNSFDRGQHYRRGFGCAGGNGDQPNRS